MATTVTPENVSKVESLIKKDLKMKYRNIMKISSGSLTHILHDCLSVRKCACWVAHNLREEQKRGRVDCCTHMLKKNWRRKVSLCLGHHNRRWNLGLPMRPWDEATVGGVGLPRWEPTSEIQQKQKCFQTNDRLFLCKMLPCCHHTALGLKGGYGWLVCQPLHA